MKQRILTSLVLRLDASLGQKLRGCPYIAGQSVDVDIANLCIEDWYVGAWKPNLLEDTTLAAVVTGRTKRPATSSVFQYAHAAANVIAWSEFVSTPDRPISILTYDEETLARYQLMMNTGEWSVDSTALSRVTVENRVMVAISLAEWAHVRGYRGPTDFVREPTASGGRRYALLRTTSHFKHFTLPSSNFAVPLLRATMGDQSYFLGATTIVLTGLRISELCRLNVTDIPFDKLKDPAWKGAAIDVLGKGNFVRPVTISRRLVESMYSYVQHERGRLLQICEQRFKKDSDIYKDAERALILNSQGRRLASRSTWAAFAKFGKLVGLKVHPHLLRHWYAANRLRTRHARLLEKNPNITHQGLREDLATVIGSIQKELGHKKIETTLIYLDSYFDEIAQEEKLAIANDIMAAVAA